MRSKEKFRVYSYFQSNKVELFNLWLDSNRDWESTTLKVERLQQQVNQSSRGWISVKGKDIVVQYGKEKGEQIIQSRTTSGLYYDDEDFPNDIDDACSEFRNLKMHNDV